MSFVENLLCRAAKYGKTIMLAEGDDARVAKAAEILTKRMFVKLFWKGTKKKLRVNSQN